MGLEFKSFKRRFLSLLLMVFALPVASLQGQEDGIFIDPNRSDPNARRSLIMSANQVETFVGNWGNIGQGDIPISGVWPRGTGHDHIHELTGIIAASVIDTAGNRIVIITDGFRDGGGTSGELDPITNIGYKFHPIAGLCQRRARAGRICQQLESTLMAIHLAQSRPDLGWQLEWLFWAEPIQRRSGILLRDG